MEQKRQHEQDSVLPNIWRCNACCYKPMRNKTTHPHKKKNLPRTVFKNIAYKKGGKNINDVQKIKTKEVWNASA